MRARLIAYAIGVAAVAAGGWALRGQIVTLETAALRPIAYQTFAGVGAALFTVQLAMLAFFVATAKGSRLRAVLVRSRGAGASTLACDTIAALVTAIGFAAIIVVDGISPTAALVIAGGLTGLQAVVGVGVARITYFVMRTVEQDALEQAQREYAEAGRRFETVTPPA